MSKLIPNTTQIPNIILDFLRPKLPEAEKECLLYICRRTFGFHKKTDRISLNQFVHGLKSKDGKILDLGTGLSRPSVNMALKNLKYAKAVFINKDKYINSYEINIDMDVYEVVKIINQLRNLTKTSKENKPVQGKLFNLQKKGKKEKLDSLNLKSGQPVDNSKTRHKINELRKDLINRKILK